LKPEDVDDAVARRVRGLLNKANMGPHERNDFAALTGALEDSSVSQDDLMLMYLEGDRDWKIDFLNMFGREPRDAYFSFEMKKP
jgi:hypothetical protein